jgi:hypothetical protein
MAAVIPMIPVAPMRASIPMLALVAMTTRARRVTWAWNLLRRTVEAAQLLAQRFDFPFIGGLLALRQFEQLEDFIELIERLAERRNHRHYFVNGLANGFRMRRLGGARRWRRRTVLARAGVLRFAGFPTGFGRLVRNFDVGGGGEELFVVIASSLSEGRFGRRGGGFGAFGRRLGVFGGLDRGILRRRFGNVGGP